MSNFRKNSVVVLILTALIGYIGTVNGEEPTIGTTENVEPGNAEEPTKVDEPVDGGEPVKVDEPVDGEEVKSVDDGKRGGVLEFDKKSTLMSGANPALR